MYIINDFTTGFSDVHHYAFLRQKLIWKKKGRANRGDGKEERKEKKREEGRGEGERESISEN